MATRGVVRLWTEDGWGVIDSPETPGGCWALWVHAMDPRLRALTPGQQVKLEWEAPGLDGYDYRAVHTWPAGEVPVDYTIHTQGPSGACSSTLNLTFDDPGTAAPQ